jgi:hypothetical protein
MMMLPPPPPWNRSKWTTLASDLSGRAREEASPVEDERLAEDRGASIGAILDIDMVVLDFDFPSLSRTEETDGLSLVDDPSAPELLSKLCWYGPALRRFLSCMGACTAIVGFGTASTSEWRQMFSRIRSKWS